MTDDQATDSAVEEMRISLREEHIQTFLETMKNEDDPTAERDALISTLSKTVSRLCDVEASFVTDLLAQDSSNVCLGCFGENMRDHVNIVAVANSFNHYLSTGSEHCEE